MSSLAITALSEVFSNEQLILAVKKGAFDELNKSYLSNLENDLTPLAILLPSSVEDVVKILGVLNPFLLAGTVQLAVRGAGQQPLRGCANIQDGITLDLRRLNSINLDAGVARIAAGARWGAVYELVQAKGLGITGSRSALGGIGGLALAGGLSFFSSREGFICDNVVNYEVVLASGKVVNANATENADLWKALRGGGNNFGIVTRFDLRTFEQGPFWGGAVYYFPPSFPAQIEALVHEVTRPKSSNQNHLMVSIGYSAAMLELGGSSCMNQMYDVGTTERSPALEPLCTMQPQIDQMNSMRVMTLTEAASEQAQQSSDGIRCAYNTTVKADVETLRLAAEAYTAALEPLKSCEGLTCSFTLQPYAASLLEASASLGGNVLGMDAAQGSLVSVLALTWWKNKEDDEKIITTFQGVIDKVDEIAAEKGTAVPFKYLNYAWSSQDPIRSYGAENVNLLKRVSKQYDPQGIFQKGIPGGFKLFT